MERKTGASCGGLCRSISALSSLEKILQEQHVCLCTVYVYIHTYSVSETKSLSLVTTDILPLRCAFSLSDFSQLFLKCKVKQSHWQGLKSHACLLLKLLPLGVQRLQQAICVNRGWLVMTAEEKKQQHQFSSRDKSPHFLPNAGQFWQTFSKVITSSCFTTLSESRSSPGYNCGAVFPLLTAGNRT